jgi:hypothetical protein
MKTEIESRTVNLPDFLIVGAAQSGTTSLYYYLKQHPQIFMPEVKEPHYFVLNGKPPRHSHPAKRTWRFEDYEGLFENAADDQIIGEASVGYLPGHRMAIKAIKRHYHSIEDLKIIMILRNPVGAVFSMFCKQSLSGKETLEFDEALKRQEERIKNGEYLGNYTGGRFYYEMVKAYMDNFPFVKVCLFEDLQADALGLAKDIYRFLDVDASFNPETVRYNPTGAPKFGFIDKMLRKPGLLSSLFPFLKLIPLHKRIELTNRIWKSNINDRMLMKKETRLYLKDLFREDIAKLQLLIGRDLSHWLK